MTMTITEHELQCARQIAEPIADADGYIRAVVKALGITIVPPQPSPEMVKLAREICYQYAHPYNETQPCYDGGHYDKLPEMQAALAALQYVEGVVLDAPTALGGAVISRGDILTAIGSNKGSGV